MSVHSLQHRNYTYILSFEIDITVITFADIMPGVIIRISFILYSQGSDYWKYEFCYGKHVKQFHDVCMPMYYHFLVCVDLLKMAKSKEDKLLLFANR